MFGMCHLIPEEVRDRVFKQIVRAYKYQGKRLNFVEMVVILLKEALDMRENKGRCRGKQSINSKDSE